MKIEFWHLQIIIIRWFKHFFGYRRRNLNNKEMAYVLNVSCGIEARDEMPEVKDEQF